MACPSRPEAQECQQRPVLLPSHREDEVAVAHLKVAEQAEVHAQIVALGTRRLYCAVSSSACRGTSPNASCSHRSTTSGRFSPSRTTSPTGGPASPGSSPTAAASRRAPAG